MDVTGLPIYRQLAKRTSSHGRRKLRRFLRGDYKQAIQHIRTVLKPFEGQSLAECKNEVKQVLLEMANALHRPTMKEMRGIEIPVRVSFSKPLAVLRMPDGGLSIQDAPTNTR